MPVASLAGVDYFLAIGSLRTHFFTDGAFSFHTRSKHFNENDFLIRVFMSDSPDSNKSLQGVVPLDIIFNFAKRVGMLTRNSASGALMLPGDWGIQVNE